MTGYGRGEVRGDHQAVTVEVKSVNHRYAEVVIRLPKELSPLEERVRAYVTERMSRGRIEVYVNRERVTPGAKSIQVDRDLASAYHKALSELDDSLGLEAKVPVSELLRLPDVVTVSEEAEDLEASWTRLESALGQAVDAAVTMRGSEGRRLAADLEGRLTAIGAQLVFIKERAPAVAEAYRTRLTLRATELLGGAVPDEARLAVEVVLYAERSSITEELVRLESHIAHFREFLRAAEPTGRKMDFLLQEMHRETNTMGSKIGDVSIAQAVVEVKSELEKIREQVQNIE